MNQYNILRAEIKARILAAWGNDIKVCFGRPAVPYEDHPFAVVTLDGAVQNSASGRAIERQWRWNIDGMFERVDSSDSQVLAMARIEELVQQLEPYNDDGTVPPVDPAFAGICDEHFVESFSPVEEEMPDTFYGVTIQFSCRTHVHA